MGFEASLSRMASRAAVTAASSCGAVGLNVESVLSDHQTAILLNALQLFMHHDPLYHTDVSLYSASEQKESTAQNTLVQNNDCCNALWCWGGGVQPRRARFSFIYSMDTRVQAAARTLGVSVLSVPVARRGVLLHCQSMRTVPDGCTVVSLMTGALFMPI